MATDEVPRGPEEIDPNWLTEALAERHPGVVVAAVKVEERHEATNSHARIVVSYDDPAGAPERMFVKFLPAEPGRREAIAATQMGIREARFYRDLAPHVRMRLPAVHAVAHREKDGAFLILLEDLQTTGCTVPDGTRGVSRDAAARALEDLAELHVRYEDPERRRAEAGWVREPDGPREYGQSRLAYALEHHRDRLSEGFAALAARYVDDAEVMHRAWHRAPFTVIHGDPHIGNLFDDAGRVGFLDWGLITLSMPLRDVGYFLVMALQVEDRRAYEEELIRHYLDVRRGLGGRSIDFDEAWRDHRLHAAYAVPACCQIVTFPERISEGRRRFSEAFLRRAEAAIDDLSPGALLFGQE